MHVHLLPPLAHLAGAEYKIPVEYKTQARRGCLPVEEHEG